MDTTQEKYASKRYATDAADVSNATAKAQDRSGKFDSDKLRTAYLFVVE